jgi:hypothetical protein
MYNVTLGRVCLTVFATETQESVTFALLSSYKIFRTAVNYINTLRSSCRMPIYLINFNNFFEFVKRFSWSFPISNFTSIRVLRAAQIHADRQRNMTKLLGTCSVYAKASKKENINSVQWSLYRKVKLFNLSKTAPPPPILVTLKFITVSKNGGHCSLPSATLIHSKQVIILFWYYALICVDVSGVISSSQVLWLKFLSVSQLFYLCWICTLHEIYSQ